MEDPPIEQKKEKLNATIPPYLKERMVNEVEEHRFASMSEIVTVALAYFFGHYDKRMEDEKTRRENKK